MADIGATKTVLALYRQEGEGLVLEREERFLNALFQGIYEVCEAFLKKDDKIEAACLALAAPIRGRVIKLTNLSWVIDADLFKERLSIPNVFLINDLKASAFGLLTIGPNAYYTLQQGKVFPFENKALISPGTGLGEALLFFDGKGYVPSATEGGHTDFAARNEKEFALFKFLQAKFSHVSVERVVSGLGFVNLYKFLVEGEGRAETLQVKEEMFKRDPAQVITQFGLEGGCEVCVEVVSWFSSLLGAEAGNLALKTMALGGVFLGGGIPRKILEALKKREFLEAFLAKGRFSNLLKDIPVAVVLEEKTTTLGAVLYAQKCLSTKAS